MSNSKIKKLAERHSFVTAIDALLLEAAKTQVSLLDFEKDVVNRHGVVEQLADLCVAIEVMTEKFQLDDLLGRLVEEKIDVRVKKV